MSRMIPLMLPSPRMRYPDLMATVKRRMGGRMINLVHQLAVSPKALAAYLGLQQALERRMATRDVRVSIALGLLRQPVPLLTGGPLRRGGVHALRP